MRPNKTNSEVAPVIGTKERAAKQHKSFAKALSSTYSSTGNVAHKGAEAEAKEVQQAEED